MEPNEIFTSSDFWKWCRRILLILLGANLPVVAYHASSLFGGP